jgi:hypothetical protein
MEHERLENDHTNLNRTYKKVIVKQFNRMAVFIY